MRALFAADGTSLRPGVGERSPLTRFRSFLRLDEQPDPPLMIQGVRHAWDVFALPAAEPIWFERFLTPQFRCAMSAVEGCEAYAVFSAEDIPESLRSKPWMSLIKSVRDYSCLDPDQRVALLRALGALSLYWDVERLISRHPFPVSAAASSKARHDLIRERVRFLLREQRLGRDRTFVFLDIARRAPEGSLERLEASIFFLSRALEKGVDAASLRLGRRLAEETLTAARRRCPPWEYERWNSKFWRCVSYESYLRGRRRDARLQLDRAERAARECLRLTPSTQAKFGLEDLYGVLTTKVLTEMKLEQPRRAWGIVQELIVLDPEGAWQRYEAAKICFARSELEVAAEHCRAALRLGPPRRADAARLLAECCARLNQPDESQHWHHEARRFGDAERFQGGGAPGSTSRGGRR